MRLDTEREGQRDPLVDEGKEVGDGEASRHNYPISVVPRSLPSSNQDSPLPLY